MEPAELFALRQHVPDLVEAAGPHGSILVAPGLQGRHPTTPTGKPT